MKQLIFAFIITILCSGCATTVVVKSSVPIDGTKTPVISDISVFLPENASADLAVGTFSLGAYKQDDMDVLQASIVQSIASLKRSIQTSNTTNPRLVVVVRSLVNQYSNKDGYLFGCITYCLADQQENILYQQQFYAQAEGHLVVTVGMIRNAFNKRITQQIINGVLAFYDGKILNPPPNGINDNFEEAVRTMPKVMNSGFSSSGGRVTLTARFKSGTAWDIAERTDPIDWKIYLHK